MAKVPQQILKLVERFERNIDSYRAPGYKEAQVRKEFIDPLERTVLMSGCGIRY